MLFSSVVPAMNGLLALADEGMNCVLPFNGDMDKKFTLKAAVEELGERLVGAELVRR